MEILITGATGFLGGEIAAALLGARKATGLRIVSRDAEKGKAKLAKTLAERGIPETRTRKIAAFDWDPSKETAPREALDGVDAVIHLAGESVASGRGDAERKRRIHDSRVLGTRNLGRAIEGLSRPPIFLSASAIGYYGNRGDEVLTEASAKGTGFLADVCEAWESESRTVPSCRTAIFRNGVVLGEGGALEKILPPFKAGVGGRIGSGKLWMSWVSAPDVVAVTLAALEDPRYSGVLNVTAPGVVTNQGFTEVLSKVLHRPHAVPVPAFALKLALGEMAEETLLASQRVAPVRLTELGYAFRHPDLRGALETLLEP
jgi:uncharacterized protein (TIGR01777 family)